jgi:hypothetical protein
VFLPQTGALQGRTFLAPVVLADSEGNLIVDADGKPVLQGGTRRVKAS